MLNFVFSSTQVLLGGATLVALLLGIAFVGRYYFRNRTIDQNAAASRTKYEAVDVFRFQPTLMRLGLICSLAFTFLAFNWTQFEARDLLVSLMVEDWEDIENSPPITRHEPPPPPPPPPPVFMASDELIVDTITFKSGDAKASDIIVPPPVRKAPPKPSIMPDPIPLEIGDEVPFKIVEKMPLYGDCGSEANDNLRRQCSDRAIMAFVGKEVSYPVLARENGVSGTAVIRFVVEKDGSLSDIQLVRDPGAGLGAEAERVVQLMADKGARWEPGQQRGRNVRVQFNIPIKFRLD